MSATSLALGAVSLSFQLLSGCIKGFQLFQGASNLGKDALSIQCSLDWAEYKLITWAQETGLYEDELSCSPKEQELVISTLAQIEHLFTDTEKLRKRYKLIWEKSDSSNAEAANFRASQLGDPASLTPNVLLANLTSVESRKRYAQRAASVQRGNTLPRRLIWATYDKNGMQELVKDLHGFIDYLVASLAIKTQLKMRTTLENLALRSIEKSDEISELVLLAESLKGILRNFSPGEAAAIAISDVAETKAIRLSLGVSDDGTAPRLPTTPAESALGQTQTPSAQMKAISKENVTLFARKFSQSESELAASFGTYDSERVYVESKVIKNKSQIARLKPRIHNLSRLLMSPRASAYRCLISKGVVEIIGKYKFAMIFALPPWVVSQSCSFTLMNALSGPNYFPSATVRKGLAQTLALAVLHLHSSGWLHKGIRSENVLFLRNAQPSQEELNGPEALREPYLMGYEYARYDDPQQFSESQSSLPKLDIYRHPELLSGHPLPYTRKHDVYALGLLLLELGMWQPLSVLIKDLIDVDSEDTEPDATKITAVNDYLLGNSDAGKNRKILQRVKYHMGDGYAKVTEICLTGALYGGVQSDDFGDILDRTWSIMKFRDEVLGLLRDLNM